MYPASGWVSLLRAIMEISAPAISLADRPQRAIRVNLGCRILYRACRQSARKQTKLGPDGKVAEVPARSRHSRRGSLLCCRAIRGKTVRQLCIYSCCTLDYS